MTETIEIDKSKMKDKMGRALTQSLFYEFDYTLGPAIFTLDEDHRTVKGKKLYSLKKLFLEHEDPTEYDFARTYLIGWKHWTRMNANKYLRAHFDEWREELEYAIRSSAVRTILDQALGDNFQAAKWIAEKGWEKRTPGRPSKQEVEKHHAIGQKIAEEFEEDMTRLKVVSGGA